MNATGGSKTDASSAVRSLRTSARSQSERSAGSYERASAAPSTSTRKSSDDSPKAKTVWRLLGSGFGKSFERQFERQVQDRSRCQVDRRGDRSLAPTEAGRREASCSTAASSKYHGAGESPRRCGPRRPASSSKNPMKTKFHVHRHGNEVAEHPENIDEVLIKINRCSCGGQRWSSLLVLGAVRSQVHPHGRRRTTGFGKARQVPGPRSRRLPRMRRKHMIRVPARRRLPERSRTRWKRSLLRLGKCATAPRLREGTGIIAGASVRSHGVRASVASATFSRSAFGSTNSDQTSVKATFHALLAAQVPPLKSPKSPRREALRRPASKQD